MPIDLSNLHPDFYTRIIGSLVVIVILWFLHLVVVRVLDRRFKDLRTRYHARKIGEYTIGLLAIVFLGRLWVENIESLLGFLAVVAAGLVIALREPISSIAGWLFILSRQSFDFGDRIQLGEYAGDVIDIGVFQITLLEIGNWVDADQSTGRLLHIPNNKIFGTPLTNYSQGFEYIWNEVPVHITYESNWEKAKQILQEIVDRQAGHLCEVAGERIREAAHQYIIYYSHLTPIVYTRVDSYSICLTIRYLCNPRRRRSSSEAIWEDVLRQFAQQADIQFAYPTQRFYQRGMDEQRPFPPSTEEPVEVSSTLPPFGQVNGRRDDR